MSKLKKIHIIGPAGSGKTYTSIKLSRILKIKASELDNFFWDNTDNTYSRRSSSEVRNVSLKKVLKNDSWIIEGVYYDWVIESFQKADLIILLEPSFMLCTFRMVIRFIMERVGVIRHNKKETFSGFIKTIIRNKQYYELFLPEIISILHKYNNRFVTFTKGDDAVKYILSQYCEIHKSSLLSGKKKYKR